MGTIYQRSNVYWVQYCINGKVFRESTKVRIDDPSAKSEAKKFLADKESGKRPPRSGYGILFHELLEDFLNDQIDNNRKRVEETLKRIEKHIEPRLGNIPVELMTTTTINEYIKQRKAEHAANGTINRELSWIHKAFTIAARAGKVQFVLPVYKLKEAPPRTDHYTEKEIKDLLSHVPDYIQAIIKFAVWTGWRRNEILNLAWDCVDFERNEVRILPGESKNEAPRLILMTKDMRKLLTDQRKKVEQSKHPDCPFVFHRNGEQIKDFRHWWYYALEKAKLEHRTFHGFRRTAVMNFDQAGISDRVAMALTGQKTRRIWDNYRQVPRTDLEQAMKKLNGKTSTKLTQSERGKSRKS